ncbi:Transcription factor 25 domain-containing protein [Rozella allomycis CSF55]|uniref:Transcription factor 25 domain-containing protein n=1 Tax=Rozella allomycis (strain CSF55) TaxID=988480 RepID=A0A075AXG7_ROZAC|nr:Transcription factor 25 domain-containing protein [Rozella allomycis CSF55]|eukprot:EPZ34942.1 Transcription factor 25 domain-containing protein [Rozella allomycis CSF55]
MHDFDMISHLLRSNPFHISSLLTVSDFLGHSGDAQGAANLIERALYAFERSFHPTFKVNSRNILSFNYYENRQFYLILFRHLKYQSQKGCWRTCFEFSKYIFSLNVEEDPYCMSLLMDFYALKSAQYSSLLEIFKVHEKEFSLLPNWKYSVALATYLSGNTRESEVLLSEAILYYPRIVIALNDSHGLNLGLESLIQQIPLESRIGLKIVESIYIERFLTEWKNPDLSKWIKRGLELVITNPMLESEISKSQQCKDDNYSGIPLDIYRHLFVCGIPIKFSSLELKIADAKLPRELASKDIRSHDPFPPEKGVPSVFDGDSFNGTVDRITRIAQSVLSSFFQ